MSPKRRAKRRSEVDVVSVEEVGDARLKLKLKAVAAKAYVELTTETKGMLSL